MSLMLENGTEPHGLSAKTFFADKVFLGQYEISMEDFLELAWYVLTNVNLTGPEDPRLRFLERLYRTGKVEGWGGKGERLDVIRPPLR